MRQLSLLTAVILTFLGAMPGWSTWSVGIIDPRTRTIAVAAASCTESVYGVAAIVPGVGFVFAQAASNMEAKLEAIQGMRAGRSPASILKTITDPTFDRDWTKQQYAIVTVNNRDEPVTFTGIDTPEVHGARVGKGISVQGNTLVDKQVLQAVFDSLYRATWNDDDGLVRAVMASLLAGSKEGGDRRCGAITASSAFLTVVRPGDVDSPYLNVVVRRAETEGRNAVEVLDQRVRNALAQR